MAEGEGTIEGQKMTIVGKSPEGMKYTSVEEMGDENTLSITAKMEMPDGNASESTAKYTRVKAMTDKSGKANCSKRQFGYAN